MVTGPFARHAENIRFGWAPDTGEPPLRVAVRSYLAAIEGDCGSGDVPVLLVMHQEAHSVAPGLQSIILQAGRLTIPDYAWLVAGDPAPILATVTAEALRGQVLVSEPGLAATALIAETVTDTPNGPRTRRVAAAVDRTGGTITTVRGPNDHTATVVAPGDRDLGVARWVGLLQRLHTALTLAGPATAGNPRRPPRPVLP